MAQQLCSGLNWSWRPFRKDLKSVIENKHLLDQMVNRDMTALIASGNPMIIWNYHDDGQICWCNKDRTPNSRHDICYGSGYINGYQRAGYQTNTWAANSNDLVLNNVSNSPLTTPTGTKQVLMLKGSSTGSVTTGFIPLTNNLQYGFFVSSDTHDANGSVTYQYSYDGIYWANIPNDMTTLDLTKTMIKFRAILSRSTSTAKLPSIDFFRFRYRNKKTLSEQYIEFNGYTVPAYIASKKMVSQKLDNTSGQGLIVDWPNTFWSIIEDHQLHAKDVGMFLVGRYADQRFFFSTKRESVYGEFSRLLHVEWDSRFVMSVNDVDGYVYNLN